MQKEITSLKNFNIKSFEYRLEKLEKGSERIHERIDEMDKTSHQAITKSDLKTWFLGGMGIMGLFVSVISTFSNLYIQSQIKEQLEPVKEQITVIEKEVIKIEANLDYNNSFIMRGNH